MRVGLYANGGAVRIRNGVIGLAMGGLLVGCDPGRNTGPIIMRAKPPLIERQFCIALRDAEREPQDSVVMTGTALHGTPDVFRVNCNGETHELLFKLSPPGDDDFGMKNLRKQWNKKTGAKDAECSRCPKYNVTAKFVGMVRKDASGRLAYEAQTADDLRRHKIRREGNR